MAGPSSLNIGPTCGSGFLIISVFPFFSDERIEERETEIMRKPGPHVPFPIHGNGSLRLAALNESLRLDPGGQRVH